MDRLTADGTTMTVNGFPDSDLMVQESGWFVPDDDLPFGLSITARNVPEILLEHAMESVDSEVRFVGGGQILLGNSHPDAHINGLMVAWMGQEYSAFTVRPLGSDRDLEIQRLLDSCLLNESSDGIALFDRDRMGGQIQRREVMFFDRKSGRLIDARPLSQESLSTVPRGKGKQIKSGEAWRTDYLEQSDALLILSEGAVSHLVAESQPDLLDAAATLELAWDR